ncbi:hypothetical protein J3R83DRAFT_13482 [Lanmaoa asiatica]|nr:hypothetical protein J3R83DRAFT_13482 [Lanmaoa asiatica]
MNLRRSDGSFALVRLMMRWRSCDRDFARVLIYFASKVGSYVAKVQLLGHAIVSHRSKRGWTRALSDIVLLTVPCWHYPFCLAKWAGNLHSGLLKTKIPVAWRMALMTDRARDGEDCLGSGSLAEAVMVKERFGLNGAKPELLVEEQRRILQFLLWQSTWWLDGQAHIKTDDPALNEGGEGIRAAPSSTQTGLGKALRAHSAKHTKIL